MSYVMWIVRASHLSTQELVTWIDNDDIRDTGPGRVMVVAEIKLPMESSRGVTLVSDPPDKLVVGFAVWRRHGSTARANHWRQHKPPATPHMEGELA